MPCRKSGDLNHPLLCSWCEQPSLILCTAAQKARLRRSPAPTASLLLQGSRRERGEGVFVSGSRWMWKVAGEQEQAGGGRGGRASRGWEPTSPWSKDRPPVPLRNTCECGPMVWKCSEVWSRKLKSGRKSGKSLWLDAGEQLQLPLLVYYM